MQYSFTIKTAKTWKEEQNQKGRRRVGGKVERKMASEEKEGELGKKIKKCREILISNFYLWLLEGNELTLVCISCLSLSFEEKDVIFAFKALSSMIPSFGFESSKEKVFLVSTKLLLCKISWGQEEPWCLVAHQRRGTRKCCPEKWNFETYFNEIFSLFKIYISRIAFF